MSYMTRCLLMAGCAVSLVAQSTIRVPYWKLEEPRRVSAESKATKTKASDCFWLPLRTACTGTGDGKIDYVNSFWNTGDKFSFFNQIKSDYNAASNGTTVAADLASLNFLFGPQLVAGTNVQAAPSAPNTSSSNGGLPTLSASSAGQAAQNMLHGGTIYLGTIYPLFAYGQTTASDPGNIALAVNVVGRQGIDVQNFKSGTNISVTSPPTHTNAQLESYLVINATNKQAGATTGFAGSVFLGGSYGYGYTSHEYARDYGFGPRVSRGMGEVSLGILLSGVATIRVSRGFGPSQTYTDSTTNLQARMNNFKSWSFGITFQPNNQK
jgi:hypothetical protein